MIDEATRAFLERGCATIVGTASADGTPHAQRGFACAVVDPTTVRLLLDDTDDVLRGHLDAGGRIAVTATDVPTLRSVQIKGRVRAVEDEPTAADLARRDAQADVVFGDIEATDFYPRPLAERMVPPGYLVAVIEVEELFDQTPGPSAGVRVGEGS